MLESLRGLGKRLIGVEGRDAAVFLQGLYTHDVLRTEVGGARYGAFLNHKGRVVFDAILYRRCENEFALEVDKNFYVDAVSHLKEYKLRSKISIFDLSSRQEVLVAPSKSDVTPFADPRPPLSQAMFRGIVDIQAAKSQEEEETRRSLYMGHLAEQGIGEGCDVWEKERSFPFEGNLDMLDGVSFRKGCYLGQELTHRAHTQLVTRKRLMPLVLGEKAEGAKFQKDVATNTWGAMRSQLTADGPTAVPVGTLLLASGNFAVALMRLPSFPPQSRSLVVRLPSGLRATAFVPSWWTPEALKVIDEPNDKKEM